ncbi:MAG: DUF3303 family protein [Pirellulales bacterium]
MLFMLRIDYDEQRGKSLLAYFDEHGLTRYEKGVEVRGAWVSQDRRVVYVVAAADTSEQIAAASRDLHEFGRLDFHPVVDAFQL